MLVIVLFVSLQVLKTPRYRGGAVEFFIEVICFCRYEVV
jgi:hypothetical protein